MKIISSYGGIAIIFEEKEDPDIKDLRKFIKVGKRRIVIYENMEHCLMDSLITADKIMRRHKVSRFKARIDYCTFEIKELDLKKC